MRSIIWYISFFITVIIKTIQLKILALSKSHNLDSEVEKITANWSKFIIKVSGSTVYVTGEENLKIQGAVVFISNHQSNFDIPLLMGYLRKTKGFIAKKELFKLPCVKTWMKLLKCIPIDRENIRSSAKAISDAIKVLKTGHSMIIFPEGSRSKACEMGDFKAGSFKLATKSRLPIVPITVNGTYKILEKNNMIIKPTKIYLTIHKPVYTHDLTTEQLKELTEQVKDVIQRALHYKYKN